MNKWNFIKENYIDKGLKIFPVEKNGKTPMIEKWQEDCSCDYFQVLYWYNNCKDCNWGLPCTPNDIFVLDLDTHDENKNGIANFNKLLQNIECFDNNTLEQETPSGGVHIICKTDDELKNVSNNSNVFKNYPGIDIRTDGYIVVEPSTINSKSYHMTSRLENMEPQQMSKKLKKYILENVNLKNDIKKEPYKKPTNVECGDRDNQLYSYINNIYYKTKLDYDEVMVLANYFNENILEKPFPERIIRYKVRKIFDKPRNKYIFIKLDE
jgi:hypothetical protein